ncbi:MAG: hypothetical protein QOH06_5874 [Acidobacteriota bacterium]|nr:hypothetical protein [Acidobacteriota bacterium]
MGRDQQIERPDHNASLFEIDTDVAVVAGRIQVPGQDMEKIDEGLDSFPLSVRADRSANAYFKLGNGDNGEHAFGDFR